MDKKLDWTLFAEQLEQGKKATTGTEQEAELLWKTAGKLGQKLKAPQPNLDLMMSKMNTRIENEDFADLDLYTKEDTKRIPLRRNNFLKYAASVAIVGMLSFVAFYIANDSDNQVAETKVEINSSASSKELQLADGTKITLSEGASLEYPNAFLGDNRTVKLKGNAFFNVARDENKPFAIQMEVAKVEVLGTSFQLNESPEMVDIEVTSGKVAFSNKTGDKRYYLTKGHYGKYDAVNDELLLSLGKDHLDNNSEVRWTNDRIFFQNTALSDIMNFMEEWKGITVEWQEVNEEIKQQSRVTTFKTDASVTEMLSKVLDGTEIELHKDGSKVILK